MLQLLYQLDVNLHLNISADEHLPAGAENPWTTWKVLDRLRTQVGRSRVNMLKWGFSNEQETCDSGIRPTMQHLLVCPMMDTACSPPVLTTANGQTVFTSVIHWEGTTLHSHVPGGRTRMMSYCTCHASCLSVLLLWYRRSSRQGREHTTLAPSA